MRSVLPTVSCVAWSSLMTGRTPGGHGIYGFVDRQPESYKIYVTTARHMEAEPFSDILGRAGKRVIVVNVPGTVTPTILALVGIPVPNLDGEPLVGAG